MSKPIYHTFSMSVWAAAGELAINELGYTDDTVEVNVVNLAEGANFTPDFIKLNPNATLPTLVADGKSYTSTKDVISYLNDNAPKKVAKATAFTDKVHEDKIDPNAPLILARDEEELKAKVSGFPLTFLQNRQDALDKHSEHPEAVDFQDFYNTKKTQNGGALAVYKGQVPEEAKQGFFKAAVDHWQNIANFILEDLPAALPESGFLGGATPGEDDFHLGAWLARVVFLTGGTNAKDGYKALEKEIKKPVPAKVAAYWEVWYARPSFQKVYAASLH